MEPKRLCRASIDKKICGVCGGIAEYFNIDHTLLRVAWIILFFSAGLGFWAYLI